MSDTKEDIDKPKPVIVKNTTDLQRLKLQKLMKNPEKPVLIPERPKTKGVPVVPDFVRNVMGSSAGAGSGEFHVYRHLRRKEYARQKFMTEKAEMEKKDDEYRKKLDDNKRLADEKTAKKRAKRLKKKKIKSKIKKNKLEKSESDCSESSDSNVDEKKQRTEDIEKCKNSSCDEVVKHNTLQTEEGKEINENSEDNIDSNCKVVQENSD